MSEPTLHSAGHLPLGSVPVVARDGGAAVEARIEALSAWVASDAREAGAFIAGELAKKDHSAAWRDALVFAAEDAEFPTPELQAAVCRQLRAIALELRLDRRPGVEQVVWSALRRYGSLIESGAIHEMLPLLEPTGYVDTRLLALGCIARVFETRPPREASAFQELKDRAFAIADKLLDPDVFTSGEISAIAIQAVVVLSILGDARALECAAKAKALKREWVLRKLRRRLEAISQDWTEENPRVEGHSASDTVFALLIAELG